MSTEPTAASVALIQTGKVLLIKRAYAPYQHLWTLPGGKREPGESIEECAIREIKEELGFDVFAPRHVMTQILRTAPTIWRLAVFATESFAGEIMPCDEIADHRWVEAGQLSGLRTTSRLDDVLDRAFALFDRN